MAVEVVCEPAKTPPSNMSVRKLNSIELNTKNKITTKLQTDQKTITETQTKLNESNQKLELSLKENSENEKVLEQLMKEFKELSEQLDQDA